MAFSKWAWLINNQNPYGVKWLSGGGFKWYGNVNFSIRFWHRMKTVQKWSSVYHNNCLLKTFRSARLVLLIINSACDIEIFQRTLPSASSHASPPPHLSVLNFRSRMSLNVMIALPPFNWWCQTTANKIC